MLQNQEHDGLLNKRSSARGAESETTWQSLASDGSRLAITKDGNENDHTCYEGIRIGWFRLRLLGIDIRCSATKLL